MDTAPRDGDALAAEVVRLRREVAALRAQAETRIGLVWEKDAFTEETDFRKAFIPDLVVEEDGRPVSMLESDPGGFYCLANPPGSERQ